MVRYPGGHRRGGARRAAGGIGAQQAGVVAAKVVHPLTGIPDIVVTSDERTPLLIDAKLRQMLTRTRAEETYKMLGYIENFRNGLAAGKFQGLLAFIGPSTITTLAGPSNSRLVLIAVEQAPALREPSESHLDSEIKHWLNSRAYA
jgi:hypothetical protein